MFDVTFDEGSSWDVLVSLFKSVSELDLYSLKSEMQSVSESERDPSYHEAIALLDNEIQHRRQKYG